MRSVRILITCELSDSGLFSYNIETIKDSALHLIEESLMMLEDTIMRFGYGLLEYWIVSTALSLLQAKLRPDESRERQQQLVEKQINVCQIFLSMQHNYSSTANKVLVALTFSKINTCLIVLGAYSVIQ